MSGALRTQFIPTRAGEIAFARSGEGPPLVLLHGNGHSWREFASVIPILARSFDVIAWDMPGHGGSADIAPAAAIEDYAAVLGDVIGGLELKRPALVGSSVGSMIAAAYGAGRSDLWGIVLGEAQFRTRAWWMKAWPLVEVMFGQPVQTLDQVQPRFVRPVDADLLEHWNRERSRAGAAQMIGVMAAIADFDLSAALTKLAAPTLLLFGEAGPTVEMAADMTAVTPAGQLKIVKNAGHFVAIDQPEAYATAVCEFLS